MGRTKEEEGEEWMSGEADSETTEAIELAHGGGAVHDEMDVDTAIDEVNRRLENADVSLDTTEHNGLGLGGEGGHDLHGEEQDGGDRKLGRGRRWRKMREDRKIRIRGGEEESD